MPHSIIFYHPKFSRNVGTIMRTAELSGAEQVIIVDGSRIDNNLYHATDTARSYKRIGTIVETLEDALSLVPNHKVVCIEMSPRAVSLYDYHHEDDSVYILGSEDDGIDLNKYDHLIDDIVMIPSAKEWSHNVAIAHAFVESHRGSQMM